MNKSVVLIFLLVLGAAAVSAQQVERSIKPLRIGLGLMGAGYAGDLNYKGEQFYRFYPGFNLSFEFHGKALIKPQLQAGYGKFVSQNRSLEPIQGYRVSKYVETSFFFLDFRLKARFFRKTAFNPYLSAGIGMLNYTPRDAQGNALADNFESRLEEEQYSSMTATFPLSVGIDLRFSPILSVGFDFTHKPTTTDYLDNLGKLGLKNGNDRLNTFTLFLLVTFDPENPILRRNLKTRERRNL